MIGVENDSRSTMKTGMKPWRSKRRMPKKSERKRCRKRRVRHKKRSRSHQWHHGRTSGVYEAHQDKGVVSPEVRDEVSRCENWKPMYLPRHVTAYRCLIHKDTRGKSMASYRIGHAAHQLVHSRGLDNEFPCERNRVPRKFHQDYLNRLTGVLSNHGNKNHLPRPMEDGWIDLDEFAGAVLKDMPDLKRISTDDMAIAGTSKNLRVQRSRRDGEQPDGRNSRLAIPDPLLSGPCKRQILDEAGLY